MAGVEDAEAEARERFGIIALNIGAPVQDGPVVENLTEAATLIALGGFTPDSLQLLADNLAEARARAAAMLTAMDSTLAVLAVLLPDPEV